MNKYLGVYRIFPAVDLITGKPSSNIKDNYILGKHKIQVYRYSKNKLAIYFQSNNTVNNILYQLEAMGITFSLHQEGDLESVYLFDEQHLSKIHQLVHFQIKGKNIQAKSVRTVRKLQKKQLNKYQL